MTDSPRTLAGVPVDVDPSLPPGTTICVLDPVTGALRVRTDSGERFDAAQIADWCIAEARAADRAEQIMFGPVEVRAAALHWPGTGTA